MMIFDQTELGTHYLPQGWCGLVWPHLHPVPMSRRHVKLPKHPGTATNALVA